MNLKPSKRFFYIALVSLAVILIAFYAAREIFGPFAPEVIDENFFTAIIVALMGLFLWNRRIWSDEKKAEALKAAEGATPVDGIATADGEGVAAQGGADPEAKGRDDRD